MCSDDLLQIIIVFIVCVSLAFISCFICFRITDVEKKYIENGYTHATLQGQAVAVWVKQ